MDISSNYYDRYNQYSSQGISVQGKRGVHHKHHNDFDANKITVNPTESASSSNKPISILDNLVTSGTITRDQEQSIKKAFEKSRLSFQTQAGAEITLQNPFDSTAIIQELLHKIKMMQPKMFLTQNGRYITCHHLCILPKL